MTVQQKRKIIAEAKQRFQELSTDPEQAHSMAERILQDVLTEVGFKEVADAFDDANERIGFWYA